MTPRGASAPKKNTRNPARTAPRARQTLSAAAVCAIAYEAWAGRGRIAWVQTSGINTLRPASR